MTNYYARTNFVPDRNKDLFVKGKLYMTAYVSSRDKIRYGDIITENGHQITISTKECAYLAVSKVSCCKKTNLILSSTRKKGWEFLEGISKQDLVSLISQTKNSIFTVKFVKKNGTVRKLTGMFGVKKHLKSEYRKPTVDIDKFFIIYDMVKKDYRAVNKDTIFEARIKGKNYVVDKGYVVEGQK